MVFSYERACLGNFAVRNERFEYEKSGMILRGKREFSGINLSQNSGERDADFDVLTGKIDRENGQRFEPVERVFS